MGFAALITSNVEGDYQVYSHQLRDIEQDLFNHIGYCLRLGDGHYCVIGQFSRGYVVNLDSKSAGLADPDPL